MNMYTGTVVSAKTPKTVVVSVQRTYVHPKYGKRTSRTQKYLVHSELDVKEGDVVHFIDSKPISKMKRWTITEVVNK